MARRERHHLMGPRFARIIADVALALAFVLSMATALVDEAPHEWIGVAVFALTIAHVFLGWKMLLAQVRKRRATAVAGLVLDALLLACLLGQLASALVLSEHVLSWAPAIEGAAWARPVHMLCAYWVSPSRSSTEVCMPAFMGKIWRSTRSLSCSVA